MAQITAKIASTTTMIVAAAVTMPMTTLKRIHAAMSRTSSAMARLPSDEPRDGAEEDIREAYLPREPGSRGKQAIGDQSWLTRRRAKRSGSGAGVVYSGTR